MPKPDVSEARRNHILEAASTIFARLGFHTARMEDIVKEAGLSKGTLYWYFKSKDDIISALLQQVFAGELKKLQTLPAIDGSVSERLLQFLRQYCRELTRLSALMPLALDFYAMATRHQWVRQFLQLYYRDYRDVLKVLIQQGIDQGEFRAVDLEQGATTLIALVEGITLLWIFDPQHVSMEQQCEASAHLLLEGLKIRDEHLLP